MYVFFNLKLNKFIKFNELLKSFLLGFFNEKYQIKIFGIISIYIINNVERISSLQFNYRLNIFIVNSYCFIIYLFYILIMVLIIH